MNVTHLECALCGLKHEARRLLNLCSACGKPLLVRYDLERAKVTLTKESLPTRRADRVGDRVDGKGRMVLNEETQKTSQEQPA